MTSENFYAAVDFAKKLENKVIEYHSYEGEMTIEQSLDLFPEDYVDMTYSDLLGEYARAQKILSTRKLNIYSENTKEFPATKISKEVETKIMEMTSETLENAKQVKSEEIVFERPTENIAFEKERPSAQIIEQKNQEIKLEKTEPKIMVKEQVLPPILSPKADDIPEKSVDEVQEQINKSLGGKADELTLKKKMLELTKQLFKEKSYNKRAEIKLQIAAIKNMIVDSKSSKRDGGAIIKTLGVNQQSEVISQKDKIIDSYKNKILLIKKAFYDEVSSVEDVEKKKEIYEKFVMSVTTLIQKLPEVINEYQQYSENKHLKEIEKWKTTTKDKDALKEAEERILYIKANYSIEFSKIKKILAKEIETLVEVTGNDLFNKPEQENTIIKEVNETDEGSLLYYLHSHDLDFYRNYERKQISKADALIRAKQLIAEEKGLSGDTIDKYFKGE